MLNNLRIASPKKYATTRVTPETKAVFKATERRSFGVRPAVRVRKTGIAVIGLTIAKSAISVVRALEVGTIYSLQVL
jgi:hypothetical protein